MNNEPTTVTLLPRGNDMVEILHDGLILARAWKDGARWNTGKLHALKGIQDRERHLCRSDALGRLLTLAMLEQHHNKLNRGRTDETHRAARTASTRPTEPSP